MDKNFVASEEGLKPADLALRLEALRDRLRRFFRREVRDSSEIDDLVQEVFLRVVRRGAVDEVEHFEGYVFQTASSVLKDRYRRRQSHHADCHIPFVPELHTRTEASPEQDLIARQTLEAMGKMLMELPQRTRAVFVLRRLDNMPYLEIAQRLGLSVSAAEKHMARAVRHLLDRSRELR